MRWLAFGTVLCFSVVWGARGTAQTFSGSSLSHKSSGGGTSSWTLDENGYVGTYFTLDNPGPVTLTVNASGERPTPWRPT